MNDGKCKTVNEKKNVLKLHKIAIPYVLRRVCT